ncbi:hypothetical protein GCM10010123_38860 [Pilimelia anulata]|uniref:Ricin B lectin domain-containing protein n=1 Tax=Pilimelia anulata TaxID=53371 RepID=A0A8J3FCC0_9ACTN|nr:ricin-type beta-trefoil lectin domain protein [Pilimelia anulata]GGK05250.1 hypothetical protein GCM10010123_38860 [Pilimelia anulata]
MTGRGRRTAVRPATPGRPPRPAAGAAGRGLFARLGAEDGGSLPMALLTVLAAVLISTLQLAVGLNQFRSTGHTVARQHALSAARAGLDVAASAIRAARTAAGDGDRTRLPCGPVSGGADDAGTYAVELVYHGDDAGAASATGPGLSCTDARSGPTTPTYAVLRAVGTSPGAAPVRRALRAVYPLTLVDATATPAPTPTWGPEGETSPHPRVITAWAPSGTGMDQVRCLDAGSSTPAVGTVVRFVTCDFTKPKVLGYKQFWYYRQDGTLGTVGSIQARRPLCLDGGAATAGTQLTLRACGTPAPAQQRWFHNNAANLELAADSGGTTALSGMCVNLSTPAASGGAAVLGTGGNCHSAAYNTRQTLGMSPVVGPGPAPAVAGDCTAEAGYPCVIGQLQNWGGPMRCADRFGGVVVHMECVSLPDPTQIRWNQLWRIPVPTGTDPIVAPLYTVDGAGKRYCMAVNNRYVAQEACDPAAPAADQKWTVRGNTGNRDTMYRITDKDGRCLTHPTDADPPRSAEQVYWWTYPIYNYKIRLDTCVTRATDPNRSDPYNFPPILGLQKWNAPFVLPTDPPDPTPPTPTAAPTPAPSASGSAPGLLPLRDLREEPAP